MITRTRVILPKSFIDVTAIKVIGEAEAIKLTIHNTIVLHRSFSYFQSLASILLQIYDNTMSFR